MLLKLPHRQFLMLLAVLLAIEFVILAIAPHDRKDWMLENTLVVLFVGAMVATYRKLTLSRISYFLIRDKITLNAEDAKDAEEQNRGEATPG